MGARPSGRQRIASTPGNYMPEKTEINLSASRSTGISGVVVFVPFVQQSYENRYRSGSQRRFFIACASPFSKVTPATEGGIPGSPRLSGSPSGPRGQGAKRSSGWFRGDQGTFQLGVSAPVKTEPSHYNFGGHDEDGEKPSPRFRGGHRRCCRGTGCRSSRQGQAGRIREGLQYLRGWVLLHPRH